MLVSSPREKLVEQAALNDLKSGRTLEESFLATVGRNEEATRKLSWLDGESGEVAE